MPSSEELNAAVDAGVIARADADKLAAFLTDYRVKSGGQTVLPADDDAEVVRFVRGFHDVLLSIGVILLLLGLGYTTDISYRGFWFYPVAIVSWGLAEYLTKLKRLTLPSIVLSLAFGVSGTVALYTLITKIGGTNLPGVEDTIASYKINTLLGGISALVISLVYYLRFRLPFTLTQIVGAVAFTFTAISLIFWPGRSGPYFTSVILITGVVVFLIAVRLDLEDPTRKTILSDNAFWLHLSAALIIVHVGIGFVWETDNGHFLTQQSALMIIALNAFIAFIALLIDRRALLVTGLFYLGAALFVLIRNTAIEEGSVFAVTLLILGSALLLLGVGWRPARAFILNNLMPQSVAHKLPTLRQA